MDSEYLWGKTVTMIRVYVICEGPTEETFIRDVIAPLLAPQNIFLTARLIATSKGHKGGVLRYERVRCFVINSLKEDDNAVITTFFDLYALHNCFPGFEGCQKITDVYQKVNHLEKAFKDDIAQNNSSFAQRFLPYIQPYEFEGLLFTDIEKLTGIEPSWKSAATKLNSVRSAFASPEHINDGFETKPSARLQKHLSSPSYHKILHGILAIESIGIDPLLTECQHFQQWYYQLNNLGSLS
jgi:hypothetical protein